jgi:MYXO-CTERM domain-containing protein
VVVSPRIPFLVVLLLPAVAQAQNLLTADGPGDTYELIRTAYTVEVPDCGHAVEHISEEFDDELGKNVFVFHAHVAEDDDRCGATDRQRTEIRARADDIVAGSGETVNYAWKFRLDAAFQGSPNFTHIFQVKSDESAPVMTLTPRTETIAIDGRIGEHGATALAPFLGVWVRVDLEIHYANDGNLAMTIRRISDGELLFDYSGAADTWDDDASGHDSKFGIYRSLNSAEYLRDEQVRFADFCASKQSASDCDDDPGQEPAEGGAGGVSGGGAPGEMGGLPSGGAISTGGGGLATAGVGTAGGGGSFATGGLSGAGSVGQGPEPTNPPESTTAAPEHSGCACRTAAPRSPPAAFGTLLFAGLAGWRRRRRVL